MAQTEFTMAAPVPVPYGEPIPGAGGGAAAALPPVPTIDDARTYREYYWGKGLVPPLERVAQYLFGYRFTDVGGGGVPTPATLRDQTTTLSDRQPLTFLCLLPAVGEGVSGEVAVVHRFVRYLDAPGEDPTGFNDKVLGLLGDILPHQYPVVEIPGTVFHLVNTPVRVPTVAAMTALLPTWDLPHVALGPYNDQDPETEVVRPRYLQLIPPRLAAILIHRRRVDAKTAYQELYGAIQAEGGIDAFSDVLVWLRAACTARGGGGPQNSVPSVTHVFSPVLLPPEVHDYMVSKVAADLPVLGRGTVSESTTTEALVGAIRSLTAARGGGAIGGEEASEKAQKSVADTYRETYKTLLRFSNVGDVNELSPMWSRLANCHKSEQHTVLSQEFQKVCMSKGLSTELYTPIITTTLKQMVVGFQFGGHGPDDLTSGCQPFLVSYSGSANHYLAVAAASIGNQLSQSEQTASLADYRTIREKEKIKFPKDISETCITLCRFAVLCQVLFQGTGPAHPLVTAMWSTALTLQNISPFVTDRYQGLARVAGVGATYFPRILRAIQLGVHDYLQQVAINLDEGVLGVEVPSFAAMLQDLKRGTFHISTNWIALPDEYMTAHTPATQSLTSGGRSSASTTVSGASAATSISSLTQDAPRENVVRVTNATPDLDFSSMTIVSGGTRNVLRAHRPPTNDAGQEFCVAWWIRGGCYPNCGRSATHRPFASQAERSRLLAYVREHLVAPPAT